MIGHALAFLWFRLWANVLAAGIWSFVVWLKLHLEQAARHEDLKRHISEELTAHHGRILTIVSGERPRA